MPNLDDDLRTRLIEKFGPTIDLRARPEILRDLVAEVVRNPGVFIAGKDGHYKGDTHTKEVKPGLPPYTKNYTRGVAMDDPMGGLSEVLGEVHAQVDRMLVQALREGLKVMDTKR